VKYPDDFEIVWHGAKERPGTSTKGELLGDVATDVAPLKHQRNIDPTPTAHERMLTSIGIKNEDDLIQELLERHNGDQSRTSLREQSIREDNMGAPDSGAPLHEEGPEEPLVSR